jgi:hypothetical protein
MSNNLTFHTFVNDIKSSLRLAWRNVLSYFLANIVMAVVLVFLIMIVAIPMAAFLAFGGITALVDFEALITLNPMVLVSAAMLILMPFIALVFTVLGGIFGVTKEVVETGSTTAESSFSWLQERFLAFVGVGIMLTLIIVVPPVLVWSAAATAYGLTLTGLPLVGVEIFSFVYIYITVGLTAMVFPAVVNGKGVQAAFVESFKFATQRFDRVFGMHTALLVFLLILASPTLIWGQYIVYFPTAAFSVVSGLVAAWSAILGIASVFILYPMVIIAYTRLYHELTGLTIKAPDTPEVPLL